MSSAVLRVWVNGYVIVRGVGTEFNLIMRQRLRDGELLNKTSELKQA